MPFFYLLSEAQQISAGCNKLGMPACRGLSLVSFQFPFDGIKIIKSNSFAFAECKSKAV